MRGNAIYRKGLSLCQIWDDVLPNTPVSTFKYPFQMVTQEETETPEVFTYYLYVAKSDILLTTTLDGLTSQGDGYMYTLVNNNWSNPIPLSADGEWDFYGYPLYKNADIGGILS